jgi:hypothetical protein
VKSRLAALGEGRIGVQPAAGMALVEAVGGVEQLGPDQAAAEFRQGSSAEASTPPVCRTTMSASVPACLIERASASAPMA